MVIDNDLSPLTDTEVHYLASEHVGDEFKIVIGHCGSSEGAARVVFMGDAWANFGTAVETIRLLQFEEDVPALLPPQPASARAHIADAARRARLPGPACLTFASFDVASTCRSPGRRAPAPRRSASRTR